MVFFGAGVSVSVGWVGRGGGEGGHIGGGAVVVTVILVRVVVIDMRCAGFYNRQ